MLLNNINKIMNKFPKIILSIILLITLFFSYIAFISDHKIVTDFSMEQLFPDKDPDKDLYEQLLIEFPKEESLLFIVYKNNDGINKKSIEIISDLSEELEFVNGIEKVKSISTIIDEDILDFSKDDRDEEINRIIQSPIYSNVFIAKDGYIGNIIIKLGDEISDHNSRKKVLLNIYELLIDFPYCQEKLLLIISLLPYYLNW